MSVIPTLNDKPYLIYILRLYFVYNPKCLCTMMLMMHHMDHLPDDILDCGPSLALWEFVTERSMGEVMHSIMSQQYPFTQLATTLMWWEQLTVLWMRYPDMNDNLDY